METHNTILNELNAFCANSMIQHLGIEFIEVGDNYLRARMPVTEKTKQPFGIMHGGASMALSETVGSVLSYLSVDKEKYDVFGLEINGNHVKSVSSGYVVATARLLHKGKATHVCEIRIETEDGQPVCLSRMTNMIVEKHA